MFLSMKRRCPLFFVKSSYGQTIAHRMILVGLIEKLMVTSILLMISLNLFYYLVSHR